VPLPISLLLLPPLLLLLLLLLLLSMRLFKRLLLMLELILARVVGSAKERASKPRVKLMADRAPMEVMRPSARSP
jgi:hypothetical protein